MSLAATMLIFAASAVQAPTSICSKLTEEFISNERSMALTHDFNADMVKIDRDLIAKIEGGNPSDRARLQKREASLQNDDAKYIAQGDRITTLLIGHKCTPPNHITTWFTYSKSNSNADK